MYFCIRCVFVQLHTIERKQAEACTLSACLHTCLHWCPATQVAWTGVWKVKWSIMRESEPSQARDPKTCVCPNTSNIDGSPDTTLETQPSSDAHRTTTHHKHKLEPKCHGQTTESVCAYHLSVCVCVCVCACVCACVSVCLSVCLSVYLCCNCIINKKKTNR